MPSTFLRGLLMIEIVGLDGPISVGELARRVDADKATVSRMVTAASADGWVTRTPDGVVLGPRLPVLAHSSEVTAALNRMQPLVDAVSGVTGLFVQAYLLIGRGIVPVVSGGRPPIALPRPLGLELPIWSIAAGRALASLLPRADLEALIAAGGSTDAPLPGAAVIADVGDAVAAGLGTPRGSAPDADAMTVGSFVQAVDAVRATGFAYDHGDVHPLVHCIAVAWPGLGEPAGIGVIGSPTQIKDGRRVVEAVLRAAVDPGATRERVVQCAAAIARESD